MHASIHSPTSHWASATCQTLCQVLGAQRDIIQTLPQRSYSVLGVGGAATKKSASMIQEYVRGLQRAQGKPRKGHATHLGRVREGSLKEAAIKLNLQSEQE